MRLRANGRTSCAIGQQECLDQSHFSPRTALTRARLITPCSHELRLVLPAHDDHLQARCSRSSDPSKRSTDGSGKRMSRKAASWTWRGLGADMDRLLLTSRLRARYVAAIPAAMTMRTTSASERALTFAMTPAR